jgi:dipeptidase E
MEQILPFLFPIELENKALAYMPSDGANTKQVYTDSWENYARNNNAKFSYIDNSKEGEEAKLEIEKLNQANILVITGGNTFTLLRNLKRSGLDVSIKEMSKRDEYIICGFSAGAIVLSPSIEIAGTSGYDINNVGLKDLSGLGITDITAFSHYSEDWEPMIQNYEKERSIVVTRLRDTDYLKIDLD